MLKHIAGVGSGGAIGFEVALLSYELEVSDAPLDV